MGKQEARQVARAIVNIAHWWVLRQKNLCEVDRCLAQRKAVALFSCWLFTAAGAGSSVVTKLNNYIELVALSASSFSALNGQVCN